VVENTHRRNGVFRKQALLKSPSPHSMYPM